MMIIAVVIGQFIGIIIGCLLMLLPMSLAVKLVEKSNLPIKTGLSIVFSIGLFYWIIAYPIMRSIESGKPLSLPEGIIVLAISALINAFAVRHFLKNTYVRALIIMIITYALSIIVLLAILGGIMVWRNASNQA